MERIRYLIPIILKIYVLQKNFVYEFRPFCSYSIILNINSHFISIQKFNIKRHLSPIRTKSITLQKWYQSLLLIETTTIQKHLFLISPNISIFPKKSPFTTSNNPSFKNITILSIRLLHLLPSIISIKIAFTSFYQLPFSHLRHIFKRSNTSITMGFSLAFQRCFRNIGWPNSYSFSIHFIMNQKATWKRNLSNIPTTPSKIEAHLIRST